MDYKFFIRDNSGDTREVNLKDVLQKLFGLDATDQIDSFGICAAEDGLSSSAEIFNGIPSAIFLSKFNAEIIVVNNESLSPQEELVQDIISILHIFSCRIYGLRKCKNKIKEDKEVEKSIQNRNQTNSRTKRQDKSNHWSIKIYI